MADTTGMPNIFTMPQGSSDFNMGAITPLILGAALFGGRGLFGNNAAGAEGVTVATVNQAAQNAAQQVLMAQNQAQAIQDINRVAVDVKDTQAALQHDVAAYVRRTYKSVSRASMALLTDYSMFTIAGIPKYLSYRRHINLFKLRSEILWTN